MGTQIKSFGWLLGIAGFLFVFLSYPLPAKGIECPEGSEEIGREVVGEEVRIKCKCAPRRVLVNNKCVERSPINSEVTMTERVTIGALAAVQGVVEVQRTDGSWRRLDTGMTIRSFDRIRTGLKGRLQALLRDDTVITMGPDSEFVLDEFVYDTNDPSRNSMVAKIKSGIFRFVTGKIAKKKPASMKVKMPVGTIGIRGSNFVIKYEPATKTATFYLREGQFDVRPVLSALTTPIPGNRIVILNPWGIVKNETLSSEDWLMAVEAVGSP